MQLFLPEVGAVLFKATPVGDAGGEFVEDGEPCGFPFCNRVAGVRVYPMLVLIDSGYPWQYADDALHLFELCAAEVFAIFEEYIPVLHREQLHAHAGELGYLHRVFFECRQLQIVGEEGVNGMATFMHHGDDIAHGAGGIHKYKWHTGFRQRAVVATRGFALAAFKIEAVHLLHGLQAAAEVWAEIVKYFYCFFAQLCATGKRVQWFYASWFGITIPWAHGVEAQALLAVLYEHGLQW